MNNLNISLIINFLMHARTVTRMHLPIDHSFIPYEMMLIVILHYLNNEELTVKRLFNSGSFSEMGNRYHFNKLVKNEWIIVKDHATDHRLKLIIPSEKLILAFNQIAKSLKPL